MRRRATIGDVPVLFDSGAHNPQKLIESPTNEEEVIFQFFFVVGDLN